MTTMGIAPWSSDHQDLVETAISSACSITVDTLSLGQRAYSPSGALCMPVNVEGLSTMTAALQCASTFAADVGPLNAAFPGATFSFSQTSVSRVIGCILCNFF